MTAFLDRVRDRLPVGIAQVATSGVMGGFAGYTAVWLGLAAVNPLACVAVSATAALAKKVIDVVFGDKIATEYKFSNFFKDLGKFAAAFVVTAGGAMFFGLLPITFEATVILGVATAGGIVGGYWVAHAIDAVKNTIHNWRNAGSNPPPPLAPAPQQDPNAPQQDPNAPQQDPNGPQPGQQP